MTATTPDPRVDAFIDRAERWQAEFRRLRAIALGRGLGETLKWGKPCYTSGGGNVAILQGFKASCAVLFPKGALLDDPDDLLERPGPNSQAARRIRFTDVAEVDAARAALEAFIDAAAEAERAGREVELKRIEEHAVPDELRRRLDRDARLRAAFDALTPGRRRGYLLHIAGARRAATRAARVERCVPRILAGKGLHDR